MGRVALAVGCLMLMVSAAESATACLAVDQFRGLKREGQPTPGEIVLTDKTFGEWRARIGAECDLAGARDIRIEAQDQACIKAGDALVYSVPGFFGASEGRCAITDLTPKG